MLRIRMPFLRGALAILGAAALLSGALVTRAEIPVSAGDYQVALPLVTRPASPAPEPGSLPAELVGTWYSGRMLNLQIYDRGTGIWSDPGGLGHMYVFKADGSYMLASYLKLGEGTTCVSSVSKYETGMAHVEGDTLRLTPDYTRTRTRICGSAETDVEGTRETIAIPWQVGEDQYRHTKLWLSEAHGETEYYKDGLAPQVLGAWLNGDLWASQVYDSASGQWAEPAETDGEWYEFRADGSYRHGIINSGYGDDPCRPITMTYEHGILSGSGSSITLQPTLALRHTVSLCDPSDVFDETLNTNAYERWSWRFTQRDAGLMLDLLRIEGGFRERSFLPAP